MTARILILCAALALASACGRETDAPSAEQNRELNGAAEMLNKAPDSLSNVEDSALTAEQETAGNAGEE